MSHRNPASTFSLGEILMLSWMYGEMAKLRNLLSGAKLRDAESTCPSRKLAKALPVVSTLVPSLVVLLLKLAFAPQVWHSWSSWYARWTSMPILNVCLPWTQSQLLAKLMPNLRFRENVLACPKSLGSAAFGSELPKVMCGKLMLFATPGNGLLTLGLN